MIELAIKTALERITGLEAWPLLLPENQLEGVTYQRVSDPELYSGMLRTGLVSARFQITLYRVDDYPGLLAQEKAIWSEWRGMTHDVLEGVPIQYITRGGIYQDKADLVNGHTRYRLARDFTFIYREAP
ncbi:hypothetical protein [Shimwellia blattae]|uniref:Uncharacterized protein n=1 Tax=Shimwellia blattae (strain ATCC 29907 / DSM 4481 / JCM 1650 / NBRC 105725 / CDC 9005-74) TaxID=630626 RepID=I2B9E1_SHIBC|nr:hypothetical protein [Shimwellia blattae]AFJ47145.1 hypothetical protein EBL_c20540 [Shimwellia blattae DSM 4481 = NBRC 105725]GAB80735.1 hypothetical protein EB105725_08_00200 [Shimwellia blattae DSM 4481 = NBRC 105725]VDY64637.1 Uncharacterised protein [Shimwellia blattae]VEC22744.1 Uncharacterised protein [Shimwellia blattae]